MEKKRVVLKKIKNSFIYFLLIFLVLQSCNSKQKGFKVKAYYYRLGDYPEGWKYGDFFKHLDSVEYILHDSNISNDQRRKFDKMATKDIIKIESKFYDDTLMKPVLTYLRNVYKGKYAEITGIEKFEKKDTTFPQIQESYFMPLTFDRQNVYVHKDSVAGSDYLHFTILYFYKEASGYYRPIDRTIFTEDGLYANYNYFCLYNKKRKCWSYILASSMGDLRTSMLGPKASFKWLKEHLPESWGKMKLTDKVVSDSIRSYNKIYQDNFIKNTGSNNYGICFCD